MPKSRRGQATRRKLLAAAEDCFGRLGYAGASVAEIVRIAEVSQGGFYVYFTSKESIFRELVEDIARGIREASSEAIARAPDRRAAELAGAHAHLRWLDEHPHMHRILHLIDEVDPELTREFYTSVSGPYATLLRRGMDAGDLEPIDPELLAFALMGLYNFVSMRWVLWTGERFPESLHGDLDTLIGRMLGRA